MLRAAEAWLSPNLAGLVAPNSPVGSFQLGEVALAQEEQPTGGEAGLLSNSAVTGSCTHHGS